MNEPSPDFVDYPVGNYPRFDELEDFTGINIDDYIEDDLPESKAQFKLARLLTDFVADDKPLHGMYQIIFFCLDRNYYRTAIEFYKQMTSPGEDEELSTEERRVGKERCGRCAASERG